MDKERQKRILASMGQLAFLSDKVMKKYENRWLTFKVVDGYWLIEWGYKDGIFGPDDIIWFKGLFRGVAWHYTSRDSNAMRYPDREHALIFERVRFLVVNRITRERKTVKLQSFFKRFPVRLLELQNVKMLPKTTCEALGLICAE